MFQRLVKHNYWKTANCILVSMGGVPTRACRRFIRRLADEKKIPVYAVRRRRSLRHRNIYRTLKVGSGNAAHLNEFFCVPQARFLGVTPQDIIDYKLPRPTRSRTWTSSGRRTRSRTTPSIQHHKPWQKAIEQMLQMGVRAEQQALAKHGLNYVIDEYLPRKLAHPERVPAVGRGTVRAGRAVRDSERQDRYTPDYERRGQDRGGRSSRPSSR